MLLVDPWLTGNPMFDAARRREAIAGATHVLLTHGHGDHASDAVAIAKELGVPVVGIFDLMSFWERKHGIATVGFNKGGTVRLGEVALTMVAATHSSSLAGRRGAGLRRHRVGLHDRRRGQDHLRLRRHRRDGRHGGLRGPAPPGDRHPLRRRALHHGHGARRPTRRRSSSTSETVIPCHYRTFPILEQSAEALQAGLPGVRVIEPQVLEPIEL